MALRDIAAQLEEPFPIEDIELLPKGSTERDGKTLCMALPYADPRVYQDRLNKLAPGEWQTPAPLALVVGNKLVCYVTIVIYGVSHTDVGEAGPGDNQGTEAFAQAFKRAASQFGLGRYLYNLDKAWVPYNAKGKRIDLDAAGIQKVVRQMYQKAGIALPGQVQPIAGNGHASEVSQNGRPSEQQLASIRKLCEHLGKPEPSAEDVDGMTYLRAKEVIGELSQEYRQMREKNPQADKADPIPSAGLSQNGTVSKPTEVPKVDDTAARRFINPLKMKAMRAGFIAGKTDGELIKAWEEAKRATFLRDVSDAELIGSEELRVQMRDAIDRHVQVNQEQKAS